MITHQNITEQIVEYFTKKIESEEWKVGEKIPSENQLTAHLGVSRASVRQAVSQLAALGVLESIHGKGTYLIDNQVKEALSDKNKITAEDLADTEKVLEFRRIVESEACYMAVANITPEMINELNKTLKTMKDSKDDMEKFISADINFHQMICEAAGNLLLTKSLNRIFIENRRAQQLTRKTFGYNDGIFYHEMILAAIEEKNAEKARKAMYDHLQNGIERVRRSKKTSIQSPVIPN